MNRPRALVEELAQPNVQRFIREHERDDPYQLTLRAHRYPDYPIAAIAEQIQARRKAQRKLPDWYATEGVIFPSLLSMEQCSSQRAAQYKQQLIGGQRLVDLTGGAGVDTYYLSQSFERTDYVEQDAWLAGITRHNLSTLGADHVRTHPTTAEAFLATIRDPVDVIYLDPARRNDQNRRVFRLADSQPNVLELHATLQAKARVVLLKTAPLLDIQATLRDLSGTTHVYVVAVDNEVKEVLYQLERAAKPDPEITAVNLRADGEELFSCYRTQEVRAEPSYAAPLTYLYEPNAALLKAGAFKLVAQRYQLYKLHPNTHLYTSDQFVANFPGRAFRCQAVVPYQKKKVRSQLAEAKANVATRNFPDSVVAVRKKLGLSDGGDTYLFAARLAQGELAVIVTEKAK